MPKTLLLADDSVTIQKVVGISFANEDIVLLTVDNGDDAIARAREARPDVILADVVMPGKNGYDVCQAIKADASLAHIPVLLLTGTFEAFDEQRASRVGADGHITKPFEAQALVDKVNALLAHPPQRAGAADDAAAGEAERKGAPIGALRPARAAVPPPPPQPVSHTADTAYDFFDDEEITAPRGGEAPRAPEAPRDDTTVLLRTTPPPAASAPPDDSFSFDEPAPAREAGLPPRAPMADPPAFGNEDLELGGPPGDDDGSLFDDFSAPAAAASAPPAPADPPPRDATPSGEFGWGARSEAEPSGFPAWESGEGDPAGTFGAEPAGAFGAEPAGAFGAEPAGAFGWDAAGETTVAPARSERAEPDWFTPRPDPQAATRLMEEPPSAADRSAAAPAPAAFEAEVPELLGGFEIDGSLESGGGTGAVLDPRGARDYDVSSSDLGPLLVAPPAPAEPEPARSSAPAPGAAAAVSSLGQRELHDALEKLAWEAFGPVAETLVRDAVERIERIAWEVIPQMAEALIREEIRKLKGE
jgi:CheY-like chemotaxis protein